MSTRRAELAGQVGDVLWDLPTFLTAPLYRRWHLHWGATIGEVHAPLPGDALLSRAHFRATRTITIDAPPEAVYPWLVLTPTDNHQTHLVTRIHASYDWSHPFSAAGLRTDRSADRRGHVPPSARFLMPRSILRSIT